MYKYMLALFKHIKMNLIEKYQEYVKRCQAVSIQPIGFVNWKGKKYGYIWNNKLYKYVKK